MIDLRLQIVGVNIQRKLNLFHLDDALVFACLFFPLLLLKAIFAVVHDFADRRFRVRSNFYEIQILLQGKFLRVSNRHDTQLLAVVGNDADFSVADIIVELQFFGSDVQTPPK